MPSKLLEAYYNSQATKKKQYKSRKEHAISTSNREDIMLAAMCLQARAESQPDTYISINNRNPNAACDAFLHQNGKRSMVEIKVRHSYTVESIDRMGGTVLERQKWASLWDIQKTIGKNEDIYYINFYKNNVMRIFKLESNYNWVHKSLPANDYNKTYGDKVVALLLHPVVETTIDQKYIDEATIMHQNKLLPTLREPSKSLTNI